MNRYELLVDGAPIGYADYQLRDNTIVFIHTEIDPPKRNKGMAGELARGALNLVRAETDLRVVVTCPYIAKWIAGHPQYADLLTR